MSEPQRIAVVLFNLGGPDKPASVEPFLRNLFSDPAIIRAPGPLRWLLARLISKRRAPVAREIYANLGGGSPILANTQAQAAALTGALADLGEIRVFIAMRYWHPRADAVAREVAGWKPSRVVLLPLYPQYSTTTTQSSFDEWERAAGAAGLSAPTVSVRAYAQEPGFIEALARAIRPKLAEARAAGRPRLLLSAHGLPKKIVAAGDPYQREVEATAAALKSVLADQPDLDAVVCYQSRVGPLEWIGPSTQSEVERAGRDKVPVVMAPIAFVSEHSETLVELDIELKHVALASGVPLYLRAPTVDASEAFIAGLARLVRAALKGG